MHKPTLLSLATLAITAILLTPVLSGLEDAKIEDMLTDLDLPTEELEQNLKNREFAIFGSVYKTEDSGEDFFASFSNGDLLSQIREEGPVSREQLDGIISELIAKHEENLKIAVFEGFMEDAQRPIKNYLINQIVIEGEDKDHQKLMVEYIDKLTTVLRKKVSLMDPEKIKNNVKTLVSGNINNLLTSFKQFSNINWETIYDEKESAVLTELINKTGTSSVKDHVESFFDFVQTYRALMSARKGKKLDAIISNFLVKLYSNPQCLADRDCSEFAGEFLNKAVAHLGEEMKSVPNAQNTFLEMVGYLYYSQYVSEVQEKLDESHRIIYREELTTFFTERKKTDNLNLDIITHEDEQTRDATAIYIIEYISNIYLSNKKTMSDNGSENFSDDENRSQDFANYNIEDSGVRQIIRNIGPILYSLHKHFDTVYLNHSAYKLINTFKLKPVLFSRLYDFHNLILQLKVTHSKTLKADNLLTKTDKFIEELYAAVEDDKEPNELNKVYPLHIDENYGFFKMFLLVDAEETPIKFNFSHSTGTEKFIQAINTSKNDKALSSVKDSESDVPISNAFIAFVNNMRKDGNVVTDLDMDDLEFVKDKDVRKSDMYKNSVEGQLMDKEFD